MERVLNDVLQLLAGATVVAKYATTQTCMVGLDKCVSLGPIDDRAMIPADVDLLIRLGFTYNRPNSSWELYTGH